MQLGMIGLGRMGANMVRRLLRSGHECVVYDRAPEAVRVLVREIGRSQTLPSKVDEIGAVFAVIERIVERGQSLGDFRDDVAARLVAWIFYGAIEEILTGWVLGQLPDGDNDVERAERTVVDVVCEGMTVR